MILTKKATFKIRKVLYPYITHFFFVAILLFRPLCAQERPTLGGLDAIITQASGVDEFLENVELQQEYYEALALYFGGEEHFPRVSYDAIILQMKEVIEKFPRMKEKLWTVDTYPVQYLRFDKGPGDTVLKREALSKFLIYTFAEAEMPKEEYKEVLKELSRKYIQALEERKNSGSYASIVEIRKQIRSTPRIQKAFMTAAKDELERLSANRTIQTGEFSEVKKVFEQISNGDFFKSAPYINQEAIGIWSLFKFPILPWKKVLSSPDFQQKQVTLTPVPRRIHGVWKGIPLKECIGGDCKLESLQTLTPNRWATSALSETRLSYLEHSNTYKGFIHEVLTVNTGTAQNFISVDFGAETLTEIVEYKGDEVLMLSLWFKSTKERPLRRNIPIASSMSLAVNNAGVKRKLLSLSMFVYGNEAGTSQNFRSVDKDSKTIANLTSPKAMNLVVNGERRKIIHDKDIRYTQTSMAFDLTSSPAAKVLRLNTSNPNFNVQETLKENIDLLVEAFEQESWERVHRILALYDFEYLYHTAPLLLKWVESINEGPSTFSGTSLITNPIRLSLQKKRFEAEIMKNLSKVQGTEATMELLEANISNYNKNMEEKRLNELGHFFIKKIKETNATEQHWLQLVEILGPYSKLQKKGIHNLLEASTPHGATKERSSEVFMKTLESIRSRGIENRQAYIDTIYDFVTINLEALTRLFNENPSIFLKFLKTAFPYTKGGDRKHYLVFTTVLNSLDLDKLSQNELLDIAENALSISKKIFKKNLPQGLKSALFLRLSQNEQTVKSIKFIYDLAPTFTEKNMYINAIESFLRNHKNSRMRANDFIVLITPYSKKDPLLEGLAIKFLDDFLESLPTTRELDRYIKYGHILERSTDVEEGEILEYISSKLPTDDEVISLLRRTDDKKSAIRNQEWNHKILEKFPLKDLKNAPISLKIHYLLKVGMVNGRLVHEELLVGINSEKKLAEALTEMLRHDDNEPYMRPLVNSLLSDDNLTSLEMQKILEALSPDSRKKLSRYLNKNSLWTKNRFFPFLRPSYFSLIENLSAVGTMNPLRFYMNKKGAIKKSHVSRIVDLLLELNDINELTSLLLGLIDELDGLDVFFKNMIRNLNNQEISDEVKRTISGVITLRKERINSKSLSSPVLLKLEQALGEPKNYFKENGIKSNLLIEVDNPNKLLREVITLIAKSDNLDDLFTSLADEITRREISDKVGKTLQGVMDLRQERITEKGVALTTLNKLEASLFLPKGHFQNREIHPRMTGDCIKSGLQDLF